MNAFFRNLFGPGGNANVEVPSPEQAFGRFVSGVQEFGQNIAGRFDAADVEAARQTSMQTQPNRSPPPASAEAIRRLPVIQVKPEDLVEPVNRECSICLELHPVNSRALRLPCAHIFHAPCALTWLHKHCTCPVCRYELPTDDDDYEKGRLVRMASRKRRFAKHELKRLSVRELLSLLKPEYRQNRPPDRADLIDYVIQTESIDLIVAPDPVEYKRSELEAMSIRRLKECMHEEAGVFFDPKEVIEKDDMLRIFYCSGRLQILPEDEEEEDEPIPTDMEIEDDDRKPAAIPTTGPLVETVHSDDEGDGHRRRQRHDYRTDTDLVMEENLDYDGEPSQVQSSVPSTTGSANVSSERCGDDVALNDEDHKNAEEESTPEPETTCSEEEHTDSNDSTSRKRLRSRQGEQVGTVDNSVASVEANVEASVEGDSVHSRFDDLGVSALRALAHEHSVDLSDCIERQEMVDRLVSFHSGTRTISNGNGSVSQEDVVATIPFDEWDVSNILALAAIVDVDLSQCANREEMVETLRLAGRTRPHAARYLQALAPLARLTIPQLRANAREWRVDVSDCIEKGDILLRLIQHELSSSA